MRPVCVGELVAHTDAVNALVAVSPFTLAAGGSDGLVSLWKVRALPIRVHRQTERARERMSACSCLRVFVWKLVCTKVQV
jgi:hypothetical protein